MSSKQDVEAPPETEEKIPLKDVDLSADENPETGGENQDGSRVRIIDNSGDPEDKTKDEDQISFVGLTKEELLEFSDDPYWKKVRLILMIIFWVGWSAMLIAAIIIIILAPKCPPRPKLEWWQTSTFYHLVPASFRDTNGDGIGDLKGVHENLDYLQGKEDSLNVTAILFNPIFPHGGVNNLYDATNFVDVTPDYGTMKEFEDLVVAMHKRNMKLILSFLPNHSSDKHPWFIKSANREGKYEDFYVWHPGKDGGNSPPNNWQAKAGGPAWSKDPVRGEYYLHQWSSTRPDLNVRNPEVQNEYDIGLRFWMEKGVDGFMPEGVSTLFECVNMTDEELKDPNGALTYGNLEHTCTLYQPESFEIVTRWRKVLDDYGDSKDKDILLIVNNQGTHNQTADFYEYNGEKGAQLSVNRNLWHMTAGCEAQCVHDKIDDWLAITEPRNLWNNWRVGDSHRSRILSRLNNDRTLINAMNLLVMTLPGTAFSYYGEEIGMHDLDSADLRPGDEHWMVEQTPLQWSSEPFAGFTEGNTTWAPISGDYKLHNIKTQKAHGASTSPLEVYQSYVELRKAPSFQWGTFKMAVADNVLFYVRQAEGFPGFLIAINLGPSLSTVDFVQSAPEGAVIPDTGVVVANTANFPNAGSDFDIGTEADLTNLILDRAQGVVFKWEKDAV